MIDGRDIVLSILMDIENNDTFSNIAITKALKQNQFEDKKDRAFITRLAEGVTETRIKLDYIVDMFSKTPIRKCKPLIRSLLRMGVYQIMYMDSIPDSAVCNEAVKLAKKHNFGSLSGFVNGVLRNIARNKNNIKLPDESNKIKYLSVNYSIPEWIVSKLEADYKECTEDILRAAFEDRMTSLRVNTLKLSREELIKYIIDEYGKKNIEAKLLSYEEAKNLTGVVAICESRYDQDGILIKGYDFVKKIPGFKKGYFAVQDESSMVCVREAGIKPGDFVLDICAAPGGKTTAAAAFLKNEGLVISRDISEEKIPLIEDNLERLGIENVTVQCFDATVLDESMIGKADVVIADVPCSGLGIMGRKNDIKYRLSKEQLDELIDLQRSILNNAVKYVKPGKVLQYSTCTINNDENIGNVKWLLDTYKDFQLVAEKQFVQGIDLCDGFYYAKLIRKE